MNTEKFTALDGKEYSKDEIVRYNFVSFGGVWSAGQRLSDEKLAKLRETGKTF